jgi:hypothetical protein
MKLMNLYYFLLFLIVNLILLSYLINLFVNLLSYLFKYTEMVMQRNRRDYYMFSSMIYKLECYC